MERPSLDFQQRQDRILGQITCIAADIISFCAEQGMNETEIRTQINHALSTLNNALDRTIKDLIK